MYVSSKIWTRKAIVESHKLASNEMSMVFYDNLQINHLKLQELKKNGNEYVTFWWHNPVQSHWCFVQPSWCLTGINLLSQVLLCELIINTRQENVTINKQQIEMLLGVINNNLQKTNEITFVNTSSLNALFQFQWIILVGSSNFQFFKYFLWKVELFCKRIIVSHEGEIIEFLLEKRWAYWNFCVVKRNFLWESRIVEFSIVKRWNHWILSVKWRTWDFAGSGTTCCRVTKFDVKKEDILTWKGGLIEFPFVSSHNCS